MVRLASLITLVTLVGLVASSAPVSARCAMRHLHPKVITTGPILAGGGIVVATEEVSRDVKDEGDAVQPTWQLEMGGTKSAPKIDTLAPGLAVYRLGAAVGTASLINGKTVIATVTASKANPAPLAAPKIKAVRHEKWLGRRATAYTTVTLDGAPPSGMVALVLADAKGTPRSFGIVTGTGVELQVYAHSRCGVLPNNTVESEPGDKVTLFWVDQSGRTSPASAVVIVGGKTNDAK